jgi:hypothetical protein
MLARSHPLPRIVPESRFFGGLTTKTPDVTVTLSPASPIPPCPALVPSRLGNEDVSLQYPITRLLGASSPDPFRGFSADVDSGGRMLGLLRELNITCSSRACAVLSVNGDGIRRGAVDNFKGPGQPPRVLFWSAQQSLRGVSPWKV